MSGSPPQTLGRYKLLALLATGGMAEIHLARQTGIQGFDRLVVIKKILPNLARQPRFLEMFFDEARIASQLNHPNIVQIHELGQEGDNYFIAMEYLEGESLAYLAHESRKTGQPLPPELAAGIVALVCDGLDYAHNLQDDAGRPLNIIHRDVSPQNIIVLFNGGVKLVDFGIAKAASQAHETRVGTLKGKLSYMSPEQCLGKAMDARSDVFCLGIVLWELLARRRLFKRGSEAPTLHAIVYEPIPPVRAVQPNVPEALQAVADRALQKDPKDRFASAAEMGEALRVHLRGTMAAAGTREIGAFINQVFAQRARTKKKLLEEIRQSNGAEIALGVLKPDTYASLPSGSKEMDAETEYSPAEDALAVPPAAPRWRLPVLAGLVSVILLAAGLIWWAPWVGDVAPDGDAGTIPAPAVPPDAGDAVTADAANLDAEMPPARLSVRSTPMGCRAEVDEVAVPGQTPIEDLQLDPDVEHAVRVSCPGYDPETKTIALKQGAADSLSFAPQKSKRAPAFGTLKLNTDPWCDVFLGQRKLGTTPLLGVRLPVGTHQLTAVNQELKIRKTIQVTIEPGKTAVVFKNLAK